MIKVIQDKSFRFVISDTKTEKILGHTSHRVFAFKVARGHAIKRNLSRVSWLRKPIAI